MYRYKRILVGLTLKEEDLTTIGYAAMISRLAGSEKVYFAHVAQTLDLPDRFVEEHAASFRPVDEYCREQMKTLVDHYFDNHGEAEILYEVREGSAPAELLKLTRQKDIDLIVVGHRRDTEERGRLPEKLARKAPCSVMIVPEGTRARIERIIVPIDFSKHSADAMEIAVAIAGAAGLAGIYCLHSFRLPRFYLETGKTYEEFAEIMKKYAEDDYATFLADVDLKGLNAMPIYELTRRPSRAIGNTVEERDIDLIVMGARGRTAAASVLLGSVTERAIHSSYRPIIAVKRKGEGLGLLRAISDATELQ